jgi:LemA protein
MIAIFIITIVITAFIALWVISTQRRLVVLDENINHAISQIGIQLSGRFDALTALLHVTKDYANYESELLIETIQSKRSMITAKSTPGHVLCQEKIVFETINRISTIAKDFPEIKSNQTYYKTMDAVQIFENMIRASRLLYNDSVMKLNREIRMFPVSFIARILGVREREYLEEMAKSDP